MIRRAWLVVLGIVLSGGFYVLLIDTVAEPQLYVLGGVVIASALAFVLAHEEHFTEARIRPWWLLRGWRVLVKIAFNIPMLCWEALVQLVAPKAARGQFRAVPFKATRDTPEQAGRRALTEWLGSAAPNTIVVGVDPDRDLLLVHQLRREGKTEQVDPIGLG